ncbi:hypothetical protein BLNAU_10002 [Blattamonas nauphoetae]|uniref:Uncharacterized protein n=1 Tax=Blattamonas nauphoetae TaxID=2049346 RepID=A0ABQ9XUB5_9EUKA|nr:hypothetical protein BLNAU_10002 [Blattamonas nauphoetae]
MSLVELVKDEVTMTLAQQEDAVFLLEVLRPGYQTLLTEDEVLKSLAPSPKGSIQGLCDSICILLTSSNQNIVENAMQIFRRIFISQPFPIKRQLMETNIIAEILALLKGPTLPVPHKEIISTHLLVVIPFLLRIGLPQWMKTLNLPTRSDQIPVRDTVLQHVVLPSKWFLRELLANRYSISKSEDLKNFVHFEIDLALTSVYYPPMFAVVMELSLPAFLTSTLAFVEADNAISRIIINLSFTVKNWQNKAGDDHHYFDRLLMCLSVEGIEDEIEQRTATDGPYVPSFINESTLSEEVSLERHLADNRVILRVGPIVNEGANSKHTFEALTGIPTLDFQFTETVAIDEASDVLVTYRTHADAITAFLKLENLFSQLEIGKVSFEPTNLLDPRRSLQDTAVWLRNLHPKVSAGKIQALIESLLDPQTGGCCNGCMMVPSGSSIDALLLFSCLRSSEITVQTLNGHMWFGRPISASIASEEDRKNEFSSHKADPCDHLGDYITCTKAASGRIYSTLTVAEGAQIHELPKYCPYNRSALERDPSNDPEPHFLISSKSTEKTKAITSTMVDAPAFQPRMKVSRSKHRSSDHHKRSIPLEQPTPIKVAVIKPATDPSPYLNTPVLPPVIAEHVEMIHTTAPNFSVLQADLRTPPSFQTSLNKPMRI